MPNSVITRKGQVTIPKAIRDEVDWREGDRVSFVVRDREVVLKVVRGSILDLEGSVEPRSRPEDFDEIRRFVRKSHQRRSDLADEPLGDRGDHMDARVVLQAG